MKFVTTNPVSRKLSNSSNLSFDTLIALVPRLLVVAMTLSAAEFALALPNQEEPSQQAWAYREYADVVTGAPYPAALLVSRSVIASQAKAKIGLGYLAVGNYVKRPMEVTLAWDSSSSWNPGTTSCKPNGCELQVRFGKGKTIHFIAVQGKHSPTLVLQDGRAFLAEAVRQSGAIEAQIQTLEDGLLTFQFNTGSLLQVNKLKK